jgi:cephalosporin hydroxylase
MFFEYRGVSAHQNEHVASVFRALFRTFKPVRVLEIGTAAGGLTLLLSDLLDEAGCAKTPIWTVDPMPMPRPYLAAAMINYIEADAFEPNLLGCLQGYVAEPGPTLVLCDGGDKRREFRTFAPHLKSGDIIMAHDYAPTMEYFQGVMFDQHWNWLEITEFDVQPVSKAQKLIPHMQDEFQRVAWACRRKA